ncbi:MAG: hypothetical protein LBS56_00960 [Propionibacteriaceae bacterium]|jgi:hypothetical protein|nr:hypothetical protein [Propionibacteriaceae bacterium]
MPRDAAPRDARPPGDAPGVGPGGPSAPRDEAWRARFVDTVTARVLDQAYVPSWRASDPTPDVVERLHEALVKFYERCGKQPDFFSDADHGVGWVFATFERLGQLAAIGRAARPGPASLEAVFEARGVDAALGDMAPLWPGPTRSVGGPASAEPDAPAPPPAPDGVADPGEVIWDFYSGPDAPRSGRLSLRLDAIKVVEGIADKGLVGPGKRVPTETWAEIAQAVGRTNRGARELYQSAKLACAAVYYVVGALGPPGALRDVGALRAAVTYFREHFTGQHEWSILLFAAHSAVPVGDGVRVDAELYAESVLRDAAQAHRLGWTPDGPAPPELLHPVEHQVADLFGRSSPRCVLSGRGGAGPGRPRATRGGVGDDVC